MTFKPSAIGEAAIEAIGSDLFEEMVAWRRHLHRNPELGFVEHQTAAFIRGLLTEWGVPFDAVTETGTVAILRGDTPGPTLMVRGDIDALPIQEENDIEYASTNDGAMHACGHDGHTAMVLGLAKYLSERKDSIVGEVRFLFQPAEETAEGGAPGIIKAGALDGVTAVVGLHLLTALPTGTITVTEGPLLGSEDRFDITITGRGGHTSGPQETVDALVIAAALVGQLQTLTSRRIDPLIPVTLSVGTLQAGEVYNAIAGTATLSGTVRTLSPEVRDIMDAELVALTTGFASAHGATAEVTYFHGNPPLINSRAAVEFALPAARATVGDHAVAYPAFLGGEDFAYYGDVVPTFFAFLGAGDEHSQPLHHAQFDIDEAALAIGLRFFIEIVARWSDETADALTAGGAPS